MLAFLVVSLFQAAAGAPADAPPTADAGAAQQEGEQTAGAPAAQQAPEAEQRRCRMVRSEGSNLRHRRCTSAAEDERAHRETSRMMRDVQSQSGRFGEVVTQGGQ